MTSWSIESSFRNGFHRNIEDAENISTYLVTITYNRFICYTLVAI